jgi:hypothetical protein
LCQAIIESKEGKVVREELCTNKLKNVCCYLCDNRESCEISCNYLSETEDVLKFKKNIEKEVMKCRKGIEKLSVFFADGRISEESYLNSISTLERRIDNLNAMKENQSTSLRNLYRFDEYEKVPIEKPTSLWYLVPFFFGIIGGLVAYVGVKERDKEMAQTLLVFGILWTSFLVLFAIIILASLLRSPFLFLFWHFHF